MSNLLGFQSQIVTEAYRTMVRTTWPSTLKVIVPGGLDAGLLREWRQRRPDGLLVLRHYFPDENLTPTKYAAILDAADQIADLKPILEVPVNESSQTSEEGVRMLAAYSASFVRLAASQGYKAAVGVFSEGNPSDLGWWGVFSPALRAARDHGGYLALHEYGVPSLGFEDWHLLRHRRVWEVLPEDSKVPILVTECGIDGGIEGRREQGWRSYMSASQYRYWLTSYHLELAKDPYVHGATLFLCGGNDQWRQFDIADEVDLRPPLTENLAMPARWTPTQEVTVPDVDLSVPERYAEAFYQSEQEGNYSKAKRPKTIGVVIHSTGGGSSSLATEAVGTVNWFQSREAGVSAHRVVGPVEVVTCVHDDLIAYHARENNQDHLGLEFAMPDGPTWATAPYPPFYYEAAGELIARWAQKYGFPIRWVTTQSSPGLITHKASAAGVRDGRRDPTGAFSPQRLLESAQRWHTQLTGGTPVPPNPTTPGDVAALRDQTWTACEALQALSAGWQAAGWPSTGAGIAAVAEAAKSLVRASKGEK